MADAQVTHAVCIEMASRLTEQAGDYVRRGLRDFAGDRAMEAMFERDGYDYSAVASMIRDGKVAQAYSYASRMETAAREEIPASVWTWMQGVASPFPAPR